MNNEELSRAVAEHEGWTKLDHGHHGCPWTNGTGAWLKVEPSYATSWNLTGPLVEKYLIALDYQYGTPRLWEATHGHAIEAKISDTPLRAICLAVLEVEE